MKKSLISCFVVLLFLIPISRAATCEPTISWTIDSQFFAGETSKLVATINNGCDTTFNIKTEVNTEKTNGYIKVYSVSSEDQKPMPKAHSVNVGSTMAYVELGKANTDDSKKKIVYFIQPDELTLPGTYTLYENFYVDDVLKQSKEIQITVKKPIQMSYRLPTTVSIGSPYSSSISMNNIGTEIISSLKVCLSSPDNVVSFSESCKTWSNIPSKYIDTFNFIVTGLAPGNYENSIEVKADYTTYTGLTVSEQYINPSLKITTKEAGNPSLSYSVIRGSGNLTFKITNKGNSSAYNCIATITSPVDCPLNSTFLISSTQSDGSNVYEIDCGDEIPKNNLLNMILTYTPGINPSCVIKGTISYKDGTGKSIETKINDLYVQTPTTTIPSKPVKQEKNTLYLSLIVIIIVVIIVLVFLKYRKPEIFEKIIKPFQKILERIIPKSNKTEVDKKE